MKPSSVSASSLDTAALCLARYKAEHIDRGANYQGDAAGVGIVCHGALEDFLRGVFIRKDMAWEWAVLEKLFHENYEKVFGTDRSLPFFQDAEDLLFRWFSRDDHYEQLSSVEILSLESKNSFPVPYVADVAGNKAKMKFNYIMDRVERTGPTTLHVVDYKSNRLALSADQLRKKKQAKYYALAMQIVYPNTTEIRVTFDFLRHEPVSVVFTREDNIETWNELKLSVQRIINTPDNNPPETLNPNCGWCVRKASCKKLQSNVAVGGIHSLDLDQLTEVYGKLVDQAKAAKILMDDIEARLLVEAAGRDTLEFDTSTSHVEVTAPQRRTVNSQAVAAILGASALEHANFTVTSVTALLKRNSPLSAGQKELLRAAIQVKVGEPTVKVTPLDPGDA